MSRARAGGGTGADPWCASRGSGRFARRAALLGLLILGLAPAAPTAAADAELARRNEELFRELQAAHHLDSSQMAAVREIFARSGFVGQGNPAITRHPLDEAQCQARNREAGVSYANAGFERICGAPYMAPLYDPRRQEAAQAPACIDQFEFPDIPCTYPVVWVRAREAAELCRAVGKRLCDAHEWEGACAGALEPPDYLFDLARGAPPAEAIATRRTAHNRAAEAHRTWSYGPEYRKGLCATSSHKSPGCEGGGWSLCGSNTFPSGSFPECRSPLGVYDLNGNAAEHMNLPLDESQLASRGSRDLGYTEMKGSWFVFDDFRAHEDWCRWRAPFWHGSRVMAPKSHANYHLGFRCCKTLDPPTPGGDPPTPGGDPPTPGGDPPTPGGDADAAPTER